VLHLARFGRTAAFKLVGTVYANFGSKPKEELVRFIIAVTAAAFLLTPAAAPAHHSNAKQHQELAQAVKKKASKPKVKKDQYMRAVPAR
jgi:sulfite exporter TauE/SafE